MKRPPDRTLQAMAFVAAAVEAATLCWRGDLAVVDRLWSVTFPGERRPSATHTIAIGRKIVEIYGDDPATWRFVIRDPATNEGSIHALYIGTDPSLPTTALQKMVAGVVGRLGRIVTRAG